MTVCGLSCTAALILSINNNPLHCCRKPHLLITICHLSNAPPPPSPAPSSRFLLLHPSQQGQLSSVPPRSASPLPLTPARLAFSSETWCSIQRDLLSLWFHTLSSASLWLQNLIIKNISSFNWPHISPLRLKHFFLTISGCTKLDHNHSSGCNYSVLNNV